MKNSHILILISFSLLFILIGITSPTQSLIQSPSFEEFFNGPSLPEWQHTDLVYVQDGALVLEKGGFAHHPESWSNFNITFRAAFEGHGDFIFHYKSNYLLLFNGERFLLQQADGENIIEITKPVPHPLPPGEWFLVELIVEGDSHIIHINGKEIYSLNLSGPVTPGGIAYEMTGDSIARVDDLSVFNLDPFATDSSEPSKRVDPIETGSKTPQASIPTPASGKIDLTWVRTGGPPGGLGYDIRYNFDNPDIWYVTDNYGGVHISNDNGLTWRQGNQGIPPQSGSSGDAKPVFCLTVDPHNSQIIWSGTDITGHIYKSTDGGKSWLEKDNGIEIEYDALSFRGFTVDPRSSDIVYAMGETTRHESGDAVWIPKGGVVYKTTDGGEKWTLIWNGDIPSSLTRYLWVNPEDTNILYVSTGIFDRGAVGQVNPDQIGTSLNPYGGLGILKSTDGGKTWRTLGKERGLDHLYVGSLYMDPEDPDILLAATGHNVPEAALDHYSKTNSSPIGVYRTTDGGESWSRVIAPLPGVGGEIFTSVEYCPSDNQIVYVGSNAAVYRSSDSGVSWDIVTGETPGWGPPGGLGGIPIDMQCDPRNPNRIFANNYQGGNYLSEDGGKTWKDASTGYTGAQIISVAVDPNQPSTVYSSGRNGVWLSTDAGLTWQAILNLSDDQILFPEWGAIRVDPSQPERILLGIEGIYYTINQGQSWSYQPIPEINPMTAVIEFSPSNPRTIYAGGASANTMVHPEVFSGWGLVVTKDGGQTWESINGAGFIDVPVLDIAIDPIDSTTLYAATQNGLFKSTNSGKDWRSFPGLPKGATHTAGINPKNPDMLFAGVEQIGFYRSQDGGISWRQVSAGLEPNGSHRDLVFDPSNPQIVYLADLMSGVYRSTDGGISWEKINNGLSTRAVTSLSISSDGQHLYAGTNGEGVFRLDLNGTPPEGSVSIISDQDESSAEETNTPSHSADSQGEEITPAGEDSMDQTLSPPSLLNVG